MSRGYTPPVTNSTDSDDANYPPIRGPRRKWIEDWAGSTTMMLGCVLAGLAFIARYWLWLWILAGVVLVTGAAIWTAAGAAAASRSRHAPGEE